jgi:hypothetical protein
MSQIKEQIENELQSFKNANPDWLTNVEKGQIVASYNNRLASIPPAGKRLLSIDSLSKMHRIILIILLYLSFLFISANRAIRLQERF